MFVLVYNRSDWESTKKLVEDVEVMDLDYNVTKTAGVKLHHQQEPMTVYTVKVYPKGIGIPETM